eukprot:935259-Alexandrium_andersonii.AAC.1
MRLALAVRVMLGYEDHRLPPLPEETGSQMAVRWIDLIPGRSGIPLGSWDPGSALKCPEVLGGGATWGVGEPRIKS